MYVWYTFLPNGTIGTMPRIAPFGTHLQAYTHRCRRVFVGVRAPGLVLDPQTGKNRLLTPPETTIFELKSAFFGTPPSKIVSATPTPKHLSTYTYAFKWY